MLPNHLVDKVGLPVICLKDSKPYFTKGKTYIIAKYPYSDIQYTTMLYIKENDLGQFDGWSSERFIVAPLTDLEKLIFDVD